MIETRNKLSIENNSSTMSDLVFLLLVFFMMTSTLISPNAVKLLLPESGSKTMAKQNVTVYIDETPPPTSTASNPSSPRALKLG